MFLYIVILCMLDSVSDSILLCKVLNFISSLNRHHIDSILKIPPSNFFVECCTIRLMGPNEKDHDVYGADTTGASAVVSSANFGLDAKGETCALGGY
jgi:hypothetical protein